MLNQLLQVKIIFKLKNYLKKIYIERERERKLLYCNYSHRALIINFSLNFFFDGELLGG